MIRPTKKDKYLEITGVNYERTETPEEEDPLVTQAKPTIASTDASTDADADADASGNNPPPQVEVKIKQKKVFIDEHRFDMSADLQILLDRLDKYIYDKIDMSPLDEADDGTELNAEDLINKINKTQPMVELYYYEWALTRSLKKLEEHIQNEVITLSYLGDLFKDAASKTAFGVGAAAGLIKVSLKNKDLKLSKLLEKEYDDDFDEVEEEVKIDVSEHTYYDENVTVASHILRYKSLKYALDLVKKIRENITLIENFERLPDYFEDPEKAADNEKRLNILKINYEEKEANDIAGQSYQHAHSSNTSYYELFGEIMSDKEKEHKEKLNLISRIERNDMKDSLDKGGGVIDGTEIFQKEF